MEQDLIKALETINRRAQEAYKSRAGHDDELATIGMIAENALLRTQEEPPVLINFGANG